MISSIEHRHTIHAHYSTNLDEPDTGPPNIDVGILAQLVSSYIHLCIPRMAQALQDQYAYQPTESAIRHLRALLLFTLVVVSVSPSDRRVLYAHP